MSDAGGRVLAGLVEELPRFARRPGGTCWYQRLIRTLSPEDVVELDAALANERFESSWIAAGLDKRGIYVSDISVRRHRRGGCACPR